jgi:hypothetical protein
MINSILTTTEENQTGKQKNKTVWNITTTSSEQYNCSIRKSKGSRNEIKQTRS